MNSTQSNYGLTGSADQNMQSMVNKRPSTINPSCFGSIEDVRNTSEAAAGRVEAVVDRLCGTVPQPAETGEIRGGHSNLFDAAEQNASEIRRNLDRIFAALDRLEKRLP